MGRRVEKKDLVDPNNSRRYYYNNNWQVACVYDSNDTFKRFFVYGNYIDEVLLVYDVELSTQWYVHDHLHSPVALVSPTGTVQERYEYDAYGDCNILEPNFAPDPDGETDYDNRYLFTGRELDTLDNGSLKIQYNRNRYYDDYTGRWLTHDSLGIMPNPPKPNRFDVTAHYKDGVNLYEYVGSAPVSQGDPRGLTPWGPPPMPDLGPKCGCCGPDITASLDRFRDDVASDYNSWDEDRQKRACGTPGTFTGMWSLGGWDITTIKEITPDDKSCGSSACRQTVMVHGKCYHTETVNYYMWGVINSLCGNSEGTMLLGLAWPLFVSGRVECKKAWAEAGYSGTTTGVICPEHDFCFKTCPRSMSRPLAFYWRRGTR